MVTATLAVSVTSAALAALKTFSVHSLAGGGSRSQNAPRQGRDLQYEMHLTFEEGIFGKKNRN